MIGAAGPYPPDMLDTLTNISLLTLLGSSYAASAVSMLPNDGLMLADPLLLSAWACGVTLNVSVTLAIAGRLWWIGRRMTSLTTIPANRFKSSIFIAIESGAITLVMSAVVIALYANLAALTGFDITAQLFVCARLSNFPFDSC